MTTRAIFFDLDDTLHGYHNCSCRALAEVYNIIHAQYGVPIKELEENYSVILRKAQQLAFVDGRSRYEYITERFSNLLKSVGVDNPHLVSDLFQIYSDSLKQNMIAYPDAESTLCVLHSSYSLYLTTEGPGDAQRKVIEHLGLRSYFADLFISGELKKPKATGELFSAALEKSGCKAEESVVVGDSYERDVLGAMKAGMKGIWVNRKKAPLPQDSVAPYAQIEELSEILPILLHKD